MQEAEELHGQRAMPVEIPVHEVDDGAEQQPEANKPGDTDKSIQDQENGCKDTFDAISETCVHRNANIEEGLENRDELGNLLTNQFKGAS